MKLSPEGREHFIELLEKLTDDQREELYCIMVAYQRNDDDFVSAESFWKAAGVSPHVTA